MTRQVKSACATTRPSCGRQSCLQAAFQAAFPIRDEFLGLRCGMPARHEAGEISANCVSGLFDGGLKGRLQARLPATQLGPVHAKTAKGERRPERPPAGTIACHTKGLLSRALHGDLRLRNFDAAYIRAIAEAALITVRRCNVHPPAANLLHDGERTCARLIEPVGI